MRTVPREPDEKTEWRVVEQRRYEPDGEADLTMVIFEAVAAVEHLGLADIKDPLYDVVDVAAIDYALFGANNLTHGGESRGCIAFDYRGHRIVVWADGWVHVADPADERDT